MKMDELEKLILLMDTHELEEIEFEDEKIRVRLKKQGSAPVVTVAAPTHVAAAPASAAAAPASPAPAAAAAAPAANPRGRSIQSPFVGTFYRSPSPESDAFVQIGQVVRKGQTLCIIEAMKLMNEIEAEFDGKVLDVMIQNGEPVEFGQELFVIEPL